MPDVSNGQLGEQHESYRKGLVLGLTMAEIGFLIIFVLLLLIAWEQMERDETAGRWHEKVPISASELQALSDSKAISDIIRSELKLGPNPEPEDVRKLVRITQSINRESGESALAAAKREIENLRRTSEELERTLRDSGVRDPKLVAAKMEGQQFDLQNKEGQLARAEKKLTELGQGKGERPCWVRPDGTIDYLYEVVLTSTGIRMRELEYPDRAAERALLPMPTVQPDEVLSSAEFEARTKPLYRDGLAKNCRFFVVIYDGTEAHEKATYKSLLRIVEGHFYKRLSNASAPF
jgi:hypothetical protein